MCRFTQITGQIDNKKKRRIFGIELALVNRKTLTAEVEEVDEVPDICKEPPSNFSRMETELLSTNEFVPSNFSFFLSRTLFVVASTRTSLTFWRSDAVDERLSISCFLTLSLKQTSNCCLFSISLWVLSRCLLSTIPAILAWDDRKHGKKKQGDHQMHMSSKWT